MKKYHKANGELHEVKQVIAYNMTFKPALYQCTVCDRIFLNEKELIEK
ncbi:MAG: hypothetical protein H3Z54_09650 [archaeon]|nr:hypothetical protein [archaeon]